MPASALLKGKTQLLSAASLIPKEVGLRGKESAVPNCEASVSPLRLQVHLPVLTQEATASSRRQTHVHGAELSREVSQVGQVRD